MFRDRLLFHIAPDIYHRRLRILQSAVLAPRLLRAWDEALRLPGTASLEDSFILELQEYFGLSRQEAALRLSSGADLFARHFAQTAPDLRDGVALADVYDGTDLEVYELAEWHARRFDEGPVNYVLALEAAVRAGARRYLDYGSGIGSGAILFARHGMEVTLADVSSPMLAFAAWRLERRRLPFRQVNLRRQELGEERWDIVTMLEVLEHVADPIAVVKSIRRNLDPGRGTLIIRASFDDERPQHIRHDLRTGSRFRGLGYLYAWDLMGRNGLPIALRISRARPTGDRLAGIVDDRLLGLISRFVTGVRSARLRLLGGPDAGRPRSAGGG